MRINARKLGLKDLNQERTGRWVIPFFVFFLFFSLEFPRYLRKVNEQIKVCMMNQYGFVNEPPLNGDGRSNKSQSVNLHFEEKVMADYR